MNFCPLGQGLDISLIGYRRLLMRVKHVPLPAVKCHVELQTYYIYLYMTPCGMEKFNSEGSIKVSWLDVEIDGVCGLFGGPLIPNCYILDRLDVQTLWQPMFQTRISLSLLLSRLYCLPPLRFIPHPLFHLPLSFSQFLMFWGNAPSVSMETAIDCQGWTTLWPGSKEGHKKENISADQ